MSKGFWSKWQKCYQRNFLCLKVNSIIVHIHFCSERKSVILVTINLLFSPSSSTPDFLIQRTARYVGVINDTQVAPPQGYTIRGEACKDKCDFYGYDYTWCHKVSPSNLGNWRGSDYCSNDQSKWHDKHKQQLASYFLRKIWQFICQFCDNCKHIKWRSNFLIHK